MVFKETHTCWRITRADNVSFLIDAKAYFDALASAIRQARKSVYVVGWDIDSRLVLTQGGDGTPETPPLGQFLNQLAQETKTLEVFILAWDFPLMYLNERQWLPMVQLGWKTHRRVHFELDSEHPVGASQHQKFVVIDDSLAFCGGVDLTHSRWDTPAHRVGDARRKTPSGESYGPFHDIQVAVGGQTAKALGALFRDRWLRATGKKITAPEKPSTSPWPKTLKPDIASGCRVAIARTMPEFKDHKPVDEVRQLYLKAIGTARRRIYIENQYVTVSSICEALGRRLMEEDPPEIVIVAPKQASGVLEQSTMDAIRNQQLQQLVQKDHKKRLGIFYPFVGPEAHPVYIHSKVMIVDDRIVIAGSANLSNRSMGLDSECCLALSGDPGSEIHDAVKGLRRTLMAEHLGVTVETLAGAERDGRSLLEICRGGQRTERGLKPLDVTDAPAIDGTRWVSDPTYLDPAEPFVLDRMMDHFAREADPKQRLNPHLFRVAVSFAILMGMAAAWRWTPLSELITSERLVQWAGMVNHPLILATAIIAGFVVGGLVFVPITLMVGAAALILPPWQSLGVTLAGVVLNAWATYGLGHHIGKKSVQKLTGKKLERINQYLSRNSFVTVAVARNLPVAPFTIVNLVAGASGIRLKPYLAGTAVGMLPGIILITFFTDRMRQAFKDPNWINITAVAILAAIMAVGFVWLRKRLARKDYAQQATK